MLICFMNRKLSLYSALSFLVISIMCLKAFGHSDTSDPLVKARMANMKVIAASMKSLAKVSRGRVPFEANEVKEILSRIEKSAAMTPATFEVYATDPTSEAATEIWDNFEDFTAKASNLEVTANKFLMMVESKEQVGDALKALGATCKSCHSKYRN